MLQRAKSKIRVAGVEVLNGIYIRHRWRRDSLIGTNAAASVAATATTDDIMDSITTNAATNANTKTTATVGD